MHILTPGLRPSIPTEEVYGMAKGKNAVISSEKSMKHRSNFGDICHRFAKNKTAMLGLIIIVIICVLMLISGFLVPYSDAVTNNAQERLLKPSLAHFFGTDQFGRDIFARILYGARMSLGISLLSSAVLLVMCCFVGAAAAYYGGAVDSIIMRGMDILLCIPQTLLALAIIMVMGNGTMSLLVALIVVSIAPSVRFIYAVVLTVSEQDYIKAAKSYGAHDFRIIMKHIIPNAVGPIIVDTTMGISEIILSIASYSYLGMGIQPPTPEWGSMLSDVMDYMRAAPYMLIFPGAAILITALAFNLMGDGLRDAIDPKLKD